jgi:DNA-binding response OmpR family regulator
MPNDSASDPAATTVLVIDDDAELVGLLTALFAREGMQVRAALDGVRGLEAAAQVLPSVVLLDLMLPDLPGTEVLRRLRERSALLPVIMLTAKGDPVDRVIGLELGADDYVPKPFDPRELVARVRTVLRRARNVTAPAPAAVPVLQHFGAFTLDVTGRTLTAAGRDVPLTNLEFRVLLKLVAHPGQPLSREALSSAAQVGNYRPLERAVDVQIARLRRKLREIDPSARWIVTARGEGYLWAPPRADQPT